MKRIVLALMFVFGLSLWASAMEPWLQPLTSKAALRSYLIERSVQTYVGISGAGILYRSGDHFQAEGIDALDLCAEISSRVLDFRVINERLDASLNIQMNDQDGNLTFYGWKQLDIADTGNGLTVSNPNLTISPWFHPAIEVPVGIDWAYLRIVNDDGDQVGGVNCWVSEANGRYYLHFPWNITGDSFLPGLHGELQVQWQTGGVEIYDLSTGEAVASSDVSMTALPSIEGVKLLEVNTSEVSEVLPSVNGVGTNTVFVLTLTEQTDVTFRAKTSEGEVATGFVLKALRGSLAPSENTYSADSTIIRIPPGEYHIWFIWTEFQELETTGPGWQYYGDKGILSE